MSDILRKTSAGYWHWCPGCECVHILPTNRGWTFSDNLENLTCAPSFIHSWVHGVEGNVCHYFLRDGCLQFLGDCSHKLAGQTVRLPIFPPDLDPAYTPP